MEKAIEKVSYELWNAINQLEKTFEGQLNWFYYRKVEDLGKVLDTLIELDKKEKELNKN